MNASVCVSLIATIKKQQEMKPPGVNPAKDF